MERTDEGLGKSLCLQVGQILLSLEEIVIVMERWLGSSYDLLGRFDPRVWLHCSVEKTDEGLGKRLCLQVGRIWILLGRTSCCDGDVVGEVMIYWVI